MKERAVVMGIILALSLPVNVYAQGSWQSGEGGWYYIQEDGTPASGWIEENGKSYYLFQDGRCATDTITPDGYYVDSQGEWYRRSASILDVTFQAPDQFLKPAAGTPDWTGGESLEKLKDTVIKVFGGKRNIVITDTCIEYRAVKEKKVLMGLYKDSSREDYRLDIRIELNSESSDMTQKETYDYAVFKALLYQFSSSPEVLEQAIYSGWQGENQWQINRQTPVFAGDTQILYATGTDFGRFWLNARPEQ